jgi:homogentisate 1,2-dioxygenase
MRPYHQQGQVNKQAHVAIPEGLWEEEHGRDGFYGPVSHVLHRHPPTGWTRIDGPLKPRAYDGRQLPATHDMDAGKTWLLGNEDVRIGLVRFDESTPYAQRNADGDEVFFVHKGRGQLQTDYGWLPVEPGYYLVIPKGVTCRWTVTDALTLLLFETTAPITGPDRGLMGQHALYDPNCLIRPELKPTETDDNNASWPVRIQRLGQLTTVTYPFDPLDVAGWKGNLYPFALNTQDIRPVHSHAMHVAPSVHTTFQCQGAVICTFLPRPLEQDPQAIRVPFYHRNIDYDEFIFYHDGDFFSRDGIAPGMMTLHPAGIHHGPHPKAFAASWQKSATQEVAVMLDSVKPLMASLDAASIENPDYYLSWQTGGK